MAKQYAVTVVRFNEEDEQEELVDQYITADEAIDLMLHIKENVAEEGTEEVEEEIEEETEEEAPKPQRGSRGGYDEKKILKQLENGDKPKKVAEEHGVNVQTVYNLKARAKKGTEVETKQEPTMKRAVVTPAEKVRFLVEEGKTDEEIYGQMGNSMTSKQLREALEDAHERN